MSKKTAVMKWIDDRLKADTGLASEVDEILAEMSLEQDLAALREKRKLTQRQVARPSAAASRTSPSSSPGESRTSVSARS